MSKVQLFYNDKSERDLYTTEEHNIFVTYLPGYSKLILRTEFGQDSTILSRYDFRQGNIPQNRMQNDNPVLL